METVNVKEQYVVDENGIRHAVLVDIDEWNRLISELTAYRRMDQEPDLAPLLEQSFSFWDNEEDSIYDTL